MSRCFPYPPPGYSGNKASNEALIESIKLQRERELAKAEKKKDRKREKKEKKKEKQKLKQNGHDEKIHKKSLKVGYLQKVKENENDQLERSSLTEEHERPLFAQNPSSSSDSTQNSCKRKRHASLPAIVKQEENLTHSHGNVIRIRLSAQKQKAVDVAVSSKQGSCSTSGRTELSTQDTHLHPSLAIQENVLSTQQENNNSSLVLPPRPDARGLVCSTLGRTEVVSREDSAVPGSELPMNKPLKVELQYRDLVENWIPPLIQTELEFDDQDWLLKKKNPDSQFEKKLKTSCNVSCGSSSSWPRVQFLPEADIYALPFTVLF